MPNLPEISQFMYQYVRDFPLAMQDPSPQGEYFRQQAENFSQHPDAASRFLLMSAYEVWKQRPPQERAKLRPENFEQLSVQEQWNIDKQLGILDWDGREAS